MDALAEQEADEAERAAEAAAAGRGGGGGGGRGRGRRREGEQRLHGEEQVRRVLDSAEQQLQRAEQSQRHVAALAPRAATPSRLEQQPLQAAVLARTHDARRQQQARVLAP